jgi:hypothetical protein
MRDAPGRGRKRVLGARELQQLARLRNQAPPTGVAFLAEQFHVSRATIRRALEFLARSPDSPAVSEAADEVSGTGHA